MNFLHGSVPLNIPFGDSTKFFPSDLLGSEYTTQPSEQDNVLHVKFEQHAELLTYESEQRGYPVFQNVDTITIRMEYNETFGTVLPLINGFDSPIRAYMKSRFPKHWEYYQRIKSADIGTPIAEVVKDPSRVATLTMAGITSVEQLAHYQNEAYAWLEAERTKAAEFVRRADALTLVTEERKRMAEELQATQAELADLRIKIGSRANETGISSKAPKRISKARNGRAS